LTASKFDVLAQIAFFSFLLSIYYFVKLDLQLFNLLEIGLKLRLGDPYPFSEFLFFLFRFLFFFIEGPFLFLNNELRLHDHFLHLFHLVLNLDNFAFLNFYCLSLV
jgi:hypothetical protein